MMNDFAHIFLGSNSGEGFCSLYDQLLHGRMDDLLIIKGGPGCGKSSFMRAAAKELTAARWETAYVHCSGDPDSLDGVLFPSRRVGMVDGTAPHALEPTYTAAAERYLDLTRFYDVSAAKARREEIVARSDAYRAAYADAYRALRAADAVESECRAAVWGAANHDKLARRFVGIAWRELRGSGARGRIDRAFLGGVTHKGELCRFDTVEALCPRRYVIADSYGLAAEALARMGEAAADAGYDVLLCPNPDRPREAMHLLIPALGLAFVTSTARLPYGGEAYRRLRVDAMAEAELPRAQKSRLRLLNRIERALRDEAAEALQRAKREHDALEAAYNPCVDFDGVYALARAEAERLLNG
jgi:hypothetical protein